MGTKSHRHIATLPDGTNAVVHIDADDVRLEVDRIHKHPREMFAAQQMPDHIVIEIDRPATVTMTGLFRVQRSASFAASHEQYRANLTFVGPDELQAGNIIRTITFRPSNEQLAVMYRGHRTTKQLDAGTVNLSSFRDDTSIGSRYMVDVIDYDRCEAFVAEVVGYRISGHVLITTEANVQGLTSSEQRHVSLHYVNSTTIEMAIDDMLTVCDFMSCMVGEVISPKMVQAVSDGAVDRWGAPPTFDIYARWRQPGREIDPQYGRRCLASPMFDAATYQNALEIWMSRREQWRQSYALGSACLDNQREISRRRFLEAAAWFESIPPFYEEKLEKISGDVIASAGLAASEAFRKGDADVSAKRAQAILGAVNANSLSMRVSSALSRAREYLGPMLLPARLDDLAPELARVRGKFAHGEDAFLSKIGHLVHDATLLFEVLATALTLEALGIAVPPERSDHPLHAALFELQQFGIGVEQTTEPK